MNAEDQPRAAIIGRRIGIAAFWALAVFVAGASTRSVVAQLYGAGIAPLTANADEAACARELRVLHDGLLGRAGQELSLPRDPARTHDWLVSWDRRHAQLAGQCGSLEDTRRELLTLRNEIESMLHEHARHHLPLTERIDRALERVAPRSSHTPRIPKEI